MKEQRYDLIVIGSGAAGMSAALTAHELGLKVVILEKAPWFGGSTAYSGGATWIPNNPQQIEAGAEEPEEQALAYLRAEIGNHGNEEMWKAFLRAGPEMLRFMAERTHLQFTMRPVAPDYHPDLPGGALGYRVLDPVDFDGRKLGSRLQRLRPPIREFTILGGMMLGRNDLPHMFRLTRSPASAWHGLRIVARHLRDLLTHRRATRLTLGSAMAARLAASVFERGIALHLNTEASELITSEGRVCGVRARGPEGEIALHADKGVVLASGGVPRSTALNDTLRPHAETLGHWSMSPEHNTGDGARMAGAAGAALAADNAEPLLYAPVSLLPQPDGSVRPFPHLFLDRAKPGIIAIDSTGRRFANEASSYHDFVLALLGRGRGRAPTAPVWLLADHRAIRRYGLGAVRPAPAPLRGHLKSGYLVRGRSVDALAASLDVPGAALHATLAAFNRDAAQGEDREFGKGANAYNRYLGDAGHRPNPCLAPLDRAPFYAIRVHPGDIGAALGLRTDPAARVLDSEGAPVPGLFACGNDANSIMHGTYPGAGITLGPGLTFGFIAAHSAAGLAVPRHGGGKGSSSQGT